MNGVDAQLSAQFHAWEQHGRGHRVWPGPVAPEPPFVFFPGYTLPTIPDDGRRPTALSSFFRSLAPRPTPPPPPLPTPEPEPEPLSREDLVELVVSLPANADPSQDAFGHLLDTLNHLREPVSLELVGSPDAICLQLAVAPADAPTLQRQLPAHFPEAVLIPQADTLRTAWQALAETDTAVVEFGLARELPFPLRSDALDVLVGLTAALADLAPGELALYQVLFAPAVHPWADSLLRTIATAEGRPFFANEPDLLKQGRRKVSQPLFAAVVRIAVKSDERPWAIAREMAAALGVLGDLHGNELIPLTNDRYPYEAHVEDVWRRQSRRSGMLLNQEELTAFVHLPTAVVRSTKLRRDLGQTRPAPASTLHERGLCLGTNTHQGITVPVRLTTEQRVRHMHVIGASGTGKSTLLFNLIRQDIEHGEGIAVLDPHGDLVERILGVILPNRIGDVVLVDPSDEQHSVGFNILSAHSDLEKNLLASDLVSVFQRLSTSWGDQMGSVLGNAIRAFLESREGGTLADLRRFLIEPAFRERFLATVTDPDLVYYWRKGFSQLSGNKSIGPVLTRLETFLSPKPIRYMVSQRENRLDFADILDTGKIFLAKLPQGQMGKENAFLLGSLLVSKFQQLAMSRQAQRAEARRPFFLYVDEFHQFITPSMAEILTGARKYRLGLILAHQELRQLERDREVASAVLSNTHTRVVFRVGDGDARALQEGFANFEARDVQNLETGQAICRVEKADGDFNLTIPLGEEPDAEQAETTRQAVITASRKRYATPRADIEAALRAALVVTSTEPSPTKAADAPKPAAEAKTHETPKETGSGQESALPVTPVSAPGAPVPNQEAKPVLPPPDMGKGGAQHKAIQQRLKAGAETLGFHATIEQAVPDGGIDLVLVRGTDRIACEVSVTTTVDHEVGNVRKCLRAGFPRVAVICPEAARLEKIRAAVQGSLGTEATANVSYATPDEFLAQLAALPVPTPSPTNPPATESPTIRKGYAVKRKSATVSAEERAAREQAAITQMAEVMKHKGRS